MSNSNFGSRARPTFQAFGPGMGEEARKAMNGAFDALANWRNEMASIADRNSDAVYEKMSAAAKAAGWPGEFVDLTRQQMQSATKMQMQAMDQVMDLWEQQVKNPSAAFAMPGAIAEQMKAFTGMGASSGLFPGMPNLGAMPGFGDMSNMSMVPLQFWMQAAEMWQKSWQQALSSWMDAQSNMYGKGGPR